MTDIVGSTEHAAELGDSAWRELVQVHHRLVRDALRRHGGREIDTAGDGFFATFDAPAAAVRCALDIGDRVRELGIEIRAGIHVGEVEQVGAKVTGITVPIASRIMAMAAPSEVLVSSTVRDLTSGSGQRFADRGEHELKGVPERWRVFAVERIVPDASADAAAAPVGAHALERRAAAVRRAQLRPIWQRRPRLVMALAIGLAIVVAGAGLLIWKPWQPPALASVTENSIGIIDPGRNEVVGEVAVGTSPGGIAVGEGYAWVTNTGADTVSQINLRTRAVEGRIDVGRAPKGIAVAGGSVWAANSGERSISRINIATGRVVDTIEVGNAPTAIAGTGNVLWVANATDSTVVPVDIQTGQVGEPTGVGATPIALAADDDGLWVASEDAASVSHLDPATGVTLAAPIQLAARPRAIALDPNSLWVAAADGTVTRVDRASNRVTATALVGSNLASILVSGDGSVWAGDHGGRIYRLDAANPAASARNVATNSAVTALALVDGGIWLAAQAAPESHRGGTLHVIQYLPDDLPRYAIDPLEYPFYNASELAIDGLVGYRRVGGTAGSALLANLATAVPRPTNGGLTYTFALRPDLHYSSGDVVRATDFRRSIERSFQIASGIFGPLGPVFFSKIVGTNACTATDEDGGFVPVDSCDLSAGIVPDDQAGTVTFNLAENDPDFIYKLAMPIASPVPDSIPMGTVVEGAFPGTGPYVVTEVAEHEVRLTRNPNFQARDQVRPDGYPEEIVFTVIVGDDVAEGDARRIAMVENGEADLTSYRGLTRTSPELFARVKTQYAGQWHVAAVNTTFFQLNSSLPPFDNLDARKAVNFAIDRQHLAGLSGGAPDAAPTCQLLPPAWPGYRPYCPYTLAPDAGGRWKAPDLEEARRLIATSGTSGTEVIVGPSFLGLTEQAEYVVTVLEDLGYETSIDPKTDFAYVAEKMGSRQMQIQPNGWSPDFVTASNFLSLFQCPGDVVINYCNQDFEDAFDHAWDLQAADPAAAASEWAALDRRAVDLALLAPIANPGADFVSERVGNYQYSPRDLVLFDQMWVQ